jgi:DNA (cytosine-5)-methyltransferase 1
MSAQAKSDSLRHSVAEIFCGSGGLSRGFARTNRFDVVLGNDIKSAALRTFRFNHSAAQQVPNIIQQDIRAVPLSEIAAALKRRGIRRGGLGCLIGGPPCQGFSQMRRSEERQDSAIVRFKGYNRLDQDPRNDLVLRFLEIADQLLPKFILIENVPQMQTHAHNGTRGALLENVKELLGEMGYAAKIRIVNAADYGVPQLRERLIILASRVCDPAFPEPTHADPSSGDLLAQGRAPWITVAEAIGDLPRPAPGPTDELGGGSLGQYKRSEVSSYAQSMRSAVEFPYNHLSRHYSPAIIKTIKEMRPGETWDYASKRKREEYEPLISRFAKNGNDRSEAIERLSKEGLVNKKFFNRYYWSAYTRLAWDRPALTITANANFLGSGRFTHPVEDRGITMREAARLQSFDDDFKFITSSTDDSDTATVGTGLDMIGEAVPPLLAEKFAQSIADSLDRVSGIQTATAPFARTASSVD